MPVPALPQECQVGPLAQGQSHTCTMVEAHLQQTSVVRVVPYFLGSFNTNYIIIFRNVEIFNPKKKLKSQRIVKEILNLQVYSIF